MRILDEKYQAIILYNTNIRLYTIETGCSVDVHGVEKLELEPDGKLVVERDRTTFSDGKTITMYSCNMNCSSLAKIEKSDDQKYVDWASFTMGTHDMSSFLAKNKNSFEEFLNKILELFNKIVDVVTEYANAFWEIWNERDTPVKHTKNLHYHVNCIRSHWVLDDEEVYNYMSIDNTHSKLVYNRYVDEIAQHTNLTPTRIWGEDTEITIFSKDLKVRWYSCDMDICKKKMAF